MASVYNSKPQTANPGGRKKPNPMGFDQMAKIRQYKADNKFTKSGQDWNVPVNTLLEPNNTIPSWEFGGDERAEVSNTLKELKHQFDLTHIKKQQKEQLLDRLKADLEQATADESNLNDLNEDRDEDMENTDSQLQKIKNKHDFEIMLQSSYKHMIDRMHRDMIAYQIEANDHLESFEAKSRILVEETEKNRAAKQEKTQNHKMMRDQIKAIALDYRQRQDRHNSLEKSIANKSDAIKRKADRVKQQQQIAEQAANENRNSDELTMRDNFLAQRLWSAFMKVKMEREMSRTFEIETAFQKIRAATGHSDVQEIVSLFLTRETTYAQLLMSVSENEAKIDKLRKDNENWREKLSELQMLNNQNKEEGLTGPKPGEPDINPELKAQFSQIELLKREKEKTQEINKKVTLINDQVTSWTARITQKIDKQFNENIGEFVDKSMAFKFQKIMNAVCKQCEQIILEEDDEDRGYIMAKDFTHEFYKEPYPTYNIRVKPTPEGGEDVHDPRGGDNDKKDDDNVYNIEMEQVRRQVKARNQAVLKARIEREEKEKKRKR